MLYEVITLKKLLVMGIPSVYEMKLGKNENGPTVILMVGVNGTGKTTTTAKLARFIVDNGKSVLLAAADTFRAAAGEQLDIWANRIGVDIVRHADGADPAAVVFDACEAAIARNVDYVIVDTAGRIHTKDNLIRITSYNVCYTKLLRCAQLTLMPVARRCLNRYTLPGLKLLQIIHLLLR